VEQQTVLLVGSDTLTYSLAVCLLKAGHPVVLKTESANAARNYIASFRDEFNDQSAVQEWISPDFLVVKDFDIPGDIRLVIAVTGEDADVKIKLIRDLETHLANDTIIAINTESVSLSTLQNGARFPGRILGANWVEPVYTTFFLEIIANSLTNTECVDNFKKLATDYWKKDPYLIRGDSGIRAQLMAAMIREAFYLVTHDYATVEDIDRACRNDAGYYMSFAGNLRYMDLMGTYAYGMVMQDLNRELATDQEVPAFFTALIKNGELGMQSGKGFYEYQPGEEEKWAGLLKQFSQQIGVLIDKYPFNDKTQEVIQESN
jgi:3-hydroxybutyryl-CoA dehydrogenase